MAITRVTFLAGSAGEWRMDGVRAVVGETLPAAAALSRVEGDGFQSDAQAAWSLVGVRSNERYIEAAEKKVIGPLQEDLGRADSTLAVLIPMRKSPQWWLLSQDERRAIFEDQSRHIAIGRQYLPAVARRLYHCRDLGGDFDFLTWFEFAASSASAFDDLLGLLRQTEEWRYVDREVEVRLHRG